MKLTDLRCEYLVNPLGIDVPLPRLSWKLRSAVRGQKQTAYRVLVASKPSRLSPSGVDLWDSGKVPSDRSIHVAYGGKTLKSGSNCFWKVMAWDANGKPSAWSTTATWSMGLLKKSDWKAKWIGYPDAPLLDRDSIPEGWLQDRSSPMLRKEFALTSLPDSARVYACGLGFHELRINGKKVGDHQLSPVFTRYDRRVLYVVHDVKKMLKKGTNVIAVQLANGWYNSYTPDSWSFQMAPWRDDPKLMLRLELTGKNGSSRAIVSDSSWRASTGPLVADGIRHGEVYDARLEQPGWDKPGFNDESWAKVSLVKPPKGKLRAQMMPPIRETGEIRPVRVSRVAPGKYLFDMGQNFAGWVRLRVKGAKGTRVRLRYGEKLTPEGMLDQTNINAHMLSGPAQQNEYVLKGGRTETWSPRFCYFGFRYVEIEGYPGKPRLDDITGIVVHTDFEDAGQFECSNPDLNTIQRMTLWSYRSNYHGMPTDCPHREKNGWTGDAHLAAETGLFNFQQAASYSKWLNDFDDEQLKNGMLPGIIPTSGWGYHWGNGPAWDSAYVLIPWYVYLYRGDVRVLADHYKGMKRYVDYLNMCCGKGIATFGLGDWCPAMTQTPVSLTSTAYYYVDSLVVSNAAALLGRRREARQYLDLASGIRQAFNKRYHRKHGTYERGSLTAQSCAIYQGLTSDNARQDVLDELVATIRKKDFVFDVGILGAKYLLNALSENGKHETAYEMVRRDKAPSYIDWIRQGQTTLPECWTGFGEASRNHIMFGDISAWFYKNLAGINPDPENPGFKNTIIRPRPTGDLKWAKASHETMYGTVRSEWKIRGKHFHLDIVIPPNTTATVYLPAGNSKDVTENGKPLAALACGIGVSSNGTNTMVQVPAGSYSFKCPA